MEKQTTSSKKPIVNEVVRDFVEEKQPVIKDLNTLQLAIAESVAGIDPDPSFEVTEDLMKIILRGQRSAYVTYHGAKVYIEGTRDTLSLQDSMKPEELHLYNLEQAKAKK
jgi:hypothetical protein